MTIINENSVVVYSSEELNKALSENNGYYNIYLGDDIKLSSGIKISSYKSKITIDGMYDNVIHDFEDMKSTSASNTISVSKENKNVTVKNLNIIGYNYYGIIYVPENNDYKDVIVEYNNIVYTGTQISFNPSGLTRFIDCDITIQDNYTSGNEVCECNQIEIGGMTKIIHKSSANSSFWFRNSNPSFKILEDANVDFTSESRELMYGVNNLNLVISKNAYFKITSKNGIGYSNFGTGNTVIEDNASLYIKQTERNGSYPTWYSYGTITLNNNSTLSIINDYNNIGTSNYNIYFQTANSGFILNNPKKLVLYNKSADVIHTNSTTPFDFNFTRINLFNDAIEIDSDISPSTLPISFYKDELSSIKGTFTQTLTNITSTNYTTEELALLPSLDNFNFIGKKIISIGYFVFHVDALTENDTVMKGKTSPNASILIEYLDTQDVVLADNNGEFSYTYLALPIGIDITYNVKESNDLIYHTKKIQIVYSGELNLDSATSTIKFNLTPIKTNPILCPKTEPLLITVTDSRINSSNWKLYATINHDLTSDDGLTLEDSLVSLDGEVINILSSNKTLIYEGESNDGTTKVTNIIFNEDEKILLQIKNFIVNNTKYEAVITWILEE